MVFDFFKDLELAKGAEEIVFNTLSKLAPDYKFIDVSNDRAYYHKGDIKAVAADGKEIMIEVKDDSRIADTGNILCEESVLYYENYQRVKGNFYSDYEIYCIVSKREQKIYILDFSILKKIYKQYRQITIRHYDQENEVYLLPLKEAEKAGALIATVKFEKE